METSLEQIISEIKRQIAIAEETPIKVDTANTSSMTYGLATILSRMGFNGHMCSVEKKPSYMCSKFQFKVDNKTICEYKAYGGMEDIYNNFFDCANTCLWVLFVQKYGLVEQDDIYRLQWLFSAYNGKERPKWKKDE